MTFIIAFVVPGTGIIAFIGYGTQVSSWMLLLRAVISAGRRFVAILTGFTRRTPSAYDFQPVSNVASDRDSLVIETNLNLNSDSEYKSDSSGHSGSHGSLLDHPVHRGHDGSVEALPLLDDHWKKFS